MADFNLNFYDTVQNHKFYRLDDDIVFRKCSLSNGKKPFYGDCTHFSEETEDFKHLYCCDNNGVHFHCAQHSNVEMEYIVENFSDRYLQCPKCKKKIRIDSIQKVVEKCLRLLNIERFKDAQLIRLDDWYIPELKDSVKTESGYWIKVDVKTDRDSDTIIIVYVGHKDDNQKAQFFIKPEKLQLSSDHKDLDPAKIISKIEVTLKDRVLKHEYD